MFSVVISMEYLKLKLPMALILTIQVEVAEALVEGVVEDDFLLVEAEAVVIEMEEVIILDGIILMELMCLTQIVISILKNGNVYGDTMIIFSPIENDRQQELLPEDLAVVVVDGDVTMISKPDPLQHSDRQVVF